MNEHTYTNPRPEEPKTDTADYSIQGILSRIDRIIGDTDHIHKALESMADIPLQGGQDDYAAANKAESISNVVWARETTNQQLIRLLQKMYDDLTPQREPEDIFRFRTVIDSVQKFVEYLDEDRLAEIIESITRQMFPAMPGPRTAYQTGSASSNPAHPPNGKRNWFGGKPPHIPKAPQAPKGPNVYTSYSAQDENSFSAGVDFLRNLADQLSGVSGPSVKGAGRDDTSKDEETED